MSAFKDYLSRTATPTPPPVNPLAEAAIALGVPVFPCGANKAPLTGHGHKDATTDPSTIRAMFMDPAAVIVGVPTGRASGWAVVDVDVKDGAAGQIWLDEVSDRLPPTRTHATRSGGWHLVFRMPDAELRNSASRIAPGVDVRGDGGYVCVIGEGYHIFPDCPEPADMPDWLLEAALKPRQPPAVAPAPYRQDMQGTPYGRAALERECQAIRSAGQGTKHATLNRAAYAIGGLVSAGELQDGAAFAELSAALEAIRPDCKDYRAALKTLATAYRDGKAAPRSVPPSREPLTAPELHPAAAFLAKIQSKLSKAQVAPLPVSPEFYDVPGALDLFIRHCADTAVRQQPFLALAAGICLIGTLAGRKYRTETNLRSNIYAISIADSSAGKDHARNIIKEVLSEADLTAYLGGEDLASAPSILTALTRHPAMLFQIDEFGDFLKDVLAEKESPKKQIGRRLKTLYSSASSFMVGTEYADQSKAGRPREDIHNPHACLYATTTPRQLWEAISGSGSLEDGLMARMMFFVTPLNYPKRGKPKFIPVPKQLVDAMKAIAAGAANPETGEVGNLAGVMLATAKTEPHLVPNTAEAEAEYEAMLDAQDKSLERNEGTYVTAIVGRVAENAMKLALIRAVSRNPADPRIEGQDVRWGRALAQHCLETLLREAKNNVAATEHERNILKAHKIIKQHGPCTARDMFEHGFKLKKKERDEVMDDLLNYDVISAILVPSGPQGGRPTTKYVSNVPADDLE